MSVDVVSSTTITVTENIAAGTRPFVSATAADKEVKHKVSVSRPLGAATTPPATMVFDELVALIATALTIDFRAMLGTQGTQDANGLKLQEIYLENPATNANLITVAGGASNGYLAFGTDGKITLNPGDSVHFRFKDTLPDVDATHKTIDLAGTGTQTLKVIAVFG